MKKAIPELTTDEQAEHFVETANLSDYDLSRFKPTQFEFQAKAAQLNMRLPEALLNAVKATAKVRGVPYTRFVRETLERVVMDYDRNEDRVSRVYVLGNIQLAAEQGLVTVGGQPVHLPTRQRAMLELLIIRKGTVITKAVFRNYAFGLIEQPEIKIVDVLLMKLRRKLIEAGADHVINTVWGRGYIIEEKAAHKPADDHHEPVKGKSPQAKLRKVHYKH